jgi:hypothetical protein
LRAHVKIKIEGTIEDGAININNLIGGEAMKHDEKKTLKEEKVLTYEAPSMVKHDPVKVVQGSGGGCYYNYYYSIDYCYNTYWY